MTNGGKIQRALLFFFFEISLSGKGRLWVKIVGVMSFGKRGRAGRSQISQPWKCSSQRISDVAAELDGVDVVAV